MVVPYQGVRILPKLDFHYNTLVTTGYIPRTQHHKNLNILTSNKPAVLSFGLREPFAPDEMPRKKFKSPFFQNTLLNH